MPKNYDINSLNKELDSKIEDYSPTQKHNPPPVVVSVQSFIPQSTFDLYYTKRNRIVHKAYIKMGSSK